MIKNELAPAEDETKQISLIEGEEKARVKELHRKDEPEDFQTLYEESLKTI
jgi:hypothetical protein